MKHINPLEQLERAIAIYEDEKSTFTKKEQRVFIAEALERFTRAGKARMTGTRFLTILKKLQAAGFNIDKVIFAFRKNEESFAHITPQNK